MSVVAAIGNWLKLEARSLQRTLNARALYGLLLGAALVISLAYQPSVPAVIDMGGSSTARGIDLGDLHKRETAKYDNQEYQFRWTRGESTIKLPGMGARPYALRLKLTNGPNPARTFQVSVDGNPLTNPDGSVDIAFKPGLQEYRWMLPTALVVSGDVVIQFKVTPLLPKGDHRELGLALNRIEVVPAGAAITIPATMQLLWLLAAAGLVFAGLVRCGFAPRAALAGGSLWAIGEASFIAFNRVWLTLISDILVWTLLLAYLLIVLFDPLLDLAWRRFSWAEEDGARPGPRRWLLALFAGAFALRLCGSLHPQLVTYDLSFHVNRFEAVSKLGQYFIQVQSTEWGGRQTFYPPFVYLFMTPFSFLFEDSRTLVKWFMALLDSTRILLLYLLVRRAAGSRRAALLASFFLVALPISILPYQWIILSNIFGEWLLMIALCLVVLAYEQLRRPAAFGALTLTLALVFVSHPGVAVLGGMSFLVLSALFWVGKEPRRQLNIFVAICAAALALSFAAYHWKTVGTMAPQVWQLIQPMVEGRTGAATGVSARAPGVSCQYDRSDSELKIQVGGSVVDPTLGLKQRCVHSWPEVIIGGAQGFLNEARAYFRLLPLGTVPLALLLLRRRKAGWSCPKDGSRTMLLAGAGADGGTQLEQSAAGQDRARRRLFWSILAWMITATVFALIGLLLNVYVRYSLFAAPLVAACAGLFLASIWETGRWGKPVVWATALYFGLVALGFWYTRITVAGH